MIIKLENYLSDLSLLTKELKLVAKPAINCDIFTPIPKRDIRKSLRGYELIYYCVTFILIQSLKRDGFAVPELVITDPLAS